MHVMGCTPIAIGMQVPGCKGRGALSAIEKGGVDARIKKDDGFRYRLSMNSKKENVTAILR